MAYNDVKVCIRSLLISSQKPLSILEIQKDYFLQEGDHIPYHTLGFKSVIELLQDMNDVLVVPPNPNPDSKLTLISDEKTEHIRNMVEKQKSNPKKRKVKSYANRPNYNNLYRNNSFNRSISNKDKRNSFNHSRNNNNNYKSQNTISGFHRSSLCTNNGQGNRASSSKCGQKKHTFSSNNGKSSKEEIQNGSHSSGYVTHNLRVNIEKHISENNMIISKDYFKKLVKNHPDYSSMNVSSMQDVIDLFQDFLDINEKGVTLKNICCLKEKKNIPLIYGMTGVIQNSSNAINTYQQNNLLPRSSIVINSSNKTVNNSKSYSSECNDTVNLSNLLENLKINKHIEQDNFKNKWKNISSINKIEDKMDRSSKFTGECEKDNIVQLQDVNSIYNKNNNCDYSRENLKKKIEFVKRQTEMRQNKKNERQELNVFYSSDYLSNNLENLESSFSHSTPNKINNVQTIEISLNKNQNVPSKVLFNIANIFKIYDRGVNVENFKFIYSKMYHTIFDYTSYGFTSTIQMFTVLDQLINIRNYILYTKHKQAYSTVYKNISYTNDNNKTTQDKMIHNILSNNNRIVLHVDQLLIDSKNLTSMVLVEAYNPSLFFLQLPFMDVELECLAAQMQYFYSVESEKAYYIVQPEHIVPGLVYASSYCSFTNLKQWYRVKVLSEVDSGTVHVIHVDYGTMDYIPKTELRFLKHEFSNLKCQAIHCCLTGYNELDSITPEVTEAFLNCIGDSKVTVQVDNNFILNEQCQILHVTLTKKKSNNSKILINVNNEITIRHLKI